jgi:type IV secretory pathway VirB10-like protein
MLSNKVAVGLFALLALGGVAGAGTYLASRQPVAPAKSAVVTPPSTTPSANGAVEATEAVMDDKDAGTKPASAPVPSASAPAVPAQAPAVVPHAAPPAKTRHPESVPVAQAKPSAPAKAPASASIPPAADTRTTQAQQPSATTTAPSTQAHPAEPESTSARADRPQVVEQPPATQFFEVTVPSDSVIGLQFDTSLSSESARVEDRVVAHVTRDVRADGRTAIPAGSKVIGAVSLVDRGGRVKEQARLGVRFHTIILADGTELPLQTETIYREGESPTNASAAKVGGGAIGGAILGAILGGGKGAAIGGAIGAAGGGAAVMAGGRKAAQIAAGSPVTVKVLSPVSVTVERE